MAFDDVLIDWSMVCCRGGLLAAGCWLAGGSLWMSTNITQLKCQTIVCSPVYVSTFHEPSTGDLGRATATHLRRQIESNLTESDDLRMAVRSGRPRRLREHQREKDHGSNHWQVHAVARLPCHCCTMASKPFCTMLHPCLLHNSLQRDPSPCKRSNTWTGMSHTWDWRDRTALETPLTAASLMA